MYFDEPYMNNVCLQITTESTLSVYQSSWHYQSANLENHLSRVRMSKTSRAPSSRRNPSGVE